MPSQDKNHILIVDDSTDVQHLLKSFFKGEGYQISTADNGEQALNFLRQSPRLPDLILLDLMMPVMDGYQFNIEQQKDARFAEIPTLIMTAGTDVNRQTTLPRGRNFLKKPFTNLEILLSSVSGALVPIAPGGC